MEGMILVFHFILGILFLFFIDMPVHNDVLLNCFFSKQEGPGPLLEKINKKTVATKYKVLLIFFVGCAKLQSSAPTPLDR
jgi:hypothetical protein